MKINGAGAIVECLIEGGVDTVFGYPGGTVLHIYDALYQRSDRIRHILTAHEQGAAHAADGYARSTGKLGVVIATSGPGATNLVTGIATAYMDSVPMIAITGNVSRALLGRDSFQEIDITGVTIPVTKHNFLVRNPDELVSTVRLAFEIALSGRPGPVLIDVPKDVSAEIVDWEPIEAFSAAGSRVTASGAARFDYAQKQKAHESDQATIGQAARMISEAKLPFVYAGGGVVIADAARELLALVEKIKAPVALSLMGQGIIPSQYPLLTGMIGMHGTKVSNMAVNQADLLIAVGSRFSDRVVSDSTRFARGARILHIDIDPAEIDKNVRTDMSIIGDVKKNLHLLTELVAARETTPWENKIAQWRAQAPEYPKELSGLAPHRLMRAIHNRVGDDAIITTEVGQHQMWTAQYYPFSRPRQLITSGGLGTMGFGTGAAMGAQIGNPERRVVHIAGDGSFRMNLAELATISHYKLPIIILVINNGTLGMVRQWQTLFYEGRYSATTLDRPPDFVKLAEAFGLPGWRADSEEIFTSCFDAALRCGGPALIECKVDIDEQVLPMVPSGKPIDEQILERPGA